MMDISKNLLALLVIIVIVIFQITAWYMGHNGYIEATCIGILAGIVGVIFGIKINFKRN